MKKREGFVSNSSSTAFILDLKVDGADRIVKGNASVPRPYPGDLGRTTVFCVGLEAEAFARQYISSYHHFFDGRRLLVQEDDECTCLGHWVLRWIDKLGVENIGFARWSDEGMGGHLYYGVDKLVVDEMEYH